MAKCVRSSSAAMLTILFLLISFSYSCLGQADEKPVYKFEDTRISQADTLLAHKQYEEALKAYQQSLDVYSKESFYEGMVYTTERMAFCHRRLGDDKLSAATFQKAINLAKEKLEPNHMLLSKAYLNNGIRAHYYQNSDMATGFLDSALWIYETSPNVKAKIRKGIIRFKFYTYFYSDASVDTLIKYAFLKESTFDYSTSDVNDEVFMLTDFSRAYYRAGDYRKSITYCFEALKRCKQHSNSVEPYYYSNALFELARSLKYSGEYIEALSLTNELLEFVQQNDPQGSTLLGYLNLKAVILTDLSLYKEAREVYQEILKYPTDPRSRKDFLISVIQNLGVCYSNEGNFSKAQLFLQEALKLQKELPGSSNQKLSIRYGFLAQSHYFNSDLHLALSYYDSALTHIIPSYNGQSLEFPSDIPRDLSTSTLKLLTRKTKILHHLQESYEKGSPEALKLQSTILSFVQGISRHLFQNRSKSDSEDTKLSMADSFKGLYENAMSTSYSAYSYNKESIFISESLKNMARGKSLLFLEQLSDYNILNSKSASQQARARFGRARVAIDSLDNLINQQIAIDPLGDSVMILNTEKMKWNARLAEVRETIEKEYPDADNDLLSKDVTINSLREDHQLTDQKALVEYFVGDSVVFVVGLSGEKESFHRIKKDKKLNQALSNFLGEVNTTPHSGELNEHLKNFGESASTLYRELLQPVLDDLGEISEMIIVPDDILSRVPFEMLVSEWSGKESSFKELNYLLRNVKVSHLLSSKVSFNELTETHGKGMLGFGYAGEGIVDERAEMGGLPGALKEINFLKSNFEGDYYMGKEGTKHQFLKKAGDYDVIHLALHGKSDSVNRYNSALVFNGDRDYYMTSTDLYRTRLKSKLAVLSACETGIGKISEGEGSFSIARGFAIAGVPAIVTTLWKVNDEAGATITEQFYRNLQAGDKKDEALRQAKLKYLEESDNLTSSPFYWGSYILIGDTSTIELKGKAGLPWQWALITLVLLASLGLGLRRLSRKPFDQAA